MRTKNIVLFLALALATISTLQAQNLNRAFYAYSLDQDTLTDAGTLTFASGYNVPDLYDLSWQVELAEVSGTGAGTVTLEGSNCASCSDWSTYATFSLTDVAAQDTTFVVASWPYYRARVTITGSGTQSQLVRNHIRWINRRR